MKSLFKKGFDIPIEDSLNYPSRETVCQVIEKYCDASKEKLEFINKNLPVTFKLDGALYEATVNIARGGYCVFCKEQ